MKIATSLRDPELPEAAALLGPDGRGAVEAAIVATGGRVVDLTMAQVMYTPGQSVAVRWNVDVDWPGLGRRHESLVAAADTAGPPEGSFPVEAGDLRVGMFRWPYDPRLPGLPLASDSAERPEWWESCGPGLELEVVTYRPGRRSVIRGTGQDGQVYVKVLRPTRAARLMRRHEALVDAGLPVPEVLHTDLENGVVVTKAVPGATLRSLLETGGAVPSPEELVSLIERMPEKLLRSARRVHAPTEDVARHSSTIAAVLPEAVPLLERIRAALGEPTAPTEYEPVHGDFHDDQILVVDGAISGLLDIDGAGSGRQVDDFGTMLGHLVNRETDIGLPSYSDYLDRTFRALRTATDPQALARETAATLVGLATGPYRVQENGWERRTLRRLRLAEAWATAPQMTDLSERPHGHLTAAGEPGVISTNPNDEGAQ